ncbi:MAG: hypothetical protein ACLTG4_00555 [Oscillospiraceae bacterium]|jgi:hypothetical protein
MKRIFNGSGGRKAALILSLCLIFALAVGTTVALLKANTAPVTNTFTAAKSDIKINENVENGKKSSIQVENIGTATSYVRVKLVMNWVDGDGKVVSGGSLPMVELNTDDGWFEQGGIYYYKMPVAAKGETSNLLQEGKPIKQENAPDGCHLEVTVLAESIQAAPSQAVTASWGVDVDPATSKLTQTPPTTTP